MPSPPRMSTTMLEGLAIAIAAGAVVILASLLGFWLGVSLEAPAVC
jgi:hypothetical protein